MSDEQQPTGESQRGFEGEVRRYYATRADVEEMLKPLSKELSTHLGYHEGTKVSWTLAIPLICVLVSATAILIAALV